MGAAATGIVTILVIGTKFTHGAWMIVVAIPLLVAAMYTIRNEHELVERRVGTRSIDTAVVPDTPFVLYVESLDAATAEALDYVRALRGTDFRAIHVRGERTPPSSPEPLERVQSIPRRAGAPSLRTRARSQR